jgi:hypothetical protein
MFLCNSELIIKKNPGNDHKKKSIIKKIIPLRLHQDILRSIMEPSCSIEDQAPFFIGFVKGTCINMIPYLIHKLLHEMKVMIRVIDERSYLPRPEYVSKISPGKCPADMAAAARIKRGKNPFRTVRL